MTACRRLATGFLRTLLAGMVPLLPGPGNREIKRRAAEYITIDHQKATNLRENEAHGQPQVGKESPRTHIHSPPYSSTHAPGQNLSPHTSSLAQRDRSVTIYHSYDPPIRPTSTSPYGPLVAYSYG